MKTASNKHQNKRILARGCDPQLSAEAAKFIPLEIGNPTYVATTSDEDFFEKLKTEEWSLVYFAPGACRFSAAKISIPGSNEQTKAWGIEDYEKIITKYQGNIPIVQSAFEENSIRYLQAALDKIDN